MYSVEGSYLPGDSLAVQLADASFRYVGGEVAEGGVLLTEHVEPRGLKGYVMRRDDVLVCPQVESVVEFAVKVFDRHVRLGQSLQHHLCIRHLRAIREHTLTVTLLDPFR